MREKLLINDVHLGVQRAAGTTPKTAADLRAYLQKSLSDLMMQHIDKDIIINGDLFDEFNVPMQDVLAFYFSAANWMAAACSDAMMKNFDGPCLVLVAGNHDLAKDSSRLSSFEFVAQVLKAQYPMNVEVVQQPATVFPGLHIIPHVANQDLLDLAISQVPDDARLVLFHANYHNGFAAVQDHSLNVTEEQARALTTGKGRTLAFAHEHQARTALSGTVVCTGNQWPSSIADCLNNPHGVKMAHVIDQRLDLEPFVTWDAGEGFLDVDWDQLSSVTDSHQFIRVSGSAKAEQAPDVIAVISKFRQQSPAFVISNAVAIEGVKGMEDLPASIEMTRQFDVLGHLYELLDADQAKVVRDLVEKAEQREAA